MIVIAITLFLQKNYSHPDNKAKSTSVIIKPNYSHLVSKYLVPMTSRALFLKGQR